MHELKSLPKNFNVIKKGIKKFELRNNDRNFKIGDIISLKEFIPCKKCHGVGIQWKNLKSKIKLIKCICKKPYGRYTGRSINLKINYILSDFPGLEKGYVILCFEQGE